MWHLPHPILDTYLQCICIICLPYHVNHLRAISFTHLYVYPIPPHSFSLSFSLALFCIVRCKYLYNPIDNVQQLMRNTSPHQPYPPPTPTTPIIQIKAWKASGLCLYTLHLQGIVHSLGDDARLKWKYFQFFLNIDLNLSKQSPNK